MEESMFNHLLQEMNFNEVELRDNYDAVFHLVTAAKGAEEFYTTSNNSARTETVKQAAALDDKLIAAWTGHPHFRVIDNATDFECKMQRLIEEIASFLGEPQSFETERKFLIEYPDLEWLFEQPNCRRIEIIQTYLISEEGTEVRVRQRGINGNYVFFKTTKQKVTDIKRIELERKISEKEYLTLLMNADTSKRQIRKTRYCLSCNGFYFEIDIYPFWKDKAIVEVKLVDENTEIVFLPQIKIIKEVTGDDSYKNSALASV